MKWGRYLLAFVIAALAIAACERNMTNAPVKPAMTRDTEAPPAGADPAVYRGAAIAQQVCVQCHDIGLGDSPLVNVGAPAFRAVALRPETSVESLAAWMQASHAVMPNYMFSGPDVSDLAAFIVSLRQPEG